MDIRHLSRTGSNERGILTRANEANNPEESKLLFRSYASVAHDLRNPIHAISLQAQLYLRKAKGADEVSIKVDDLKRIIRNTDRLNHLTSDLLDVARLQTGQMYLEWETSDLRELIRHLVDSLRSVHHNHAITLAIKGKDFETCIDPFRIRQALTFLINNAITCSESNLPVDVELDEREDDFEVTIRDHGQGLEASDLGKVFTGVDLGLFITKGLIQGHGGNIRVRSQAGQGCAFIVNLPRHPSEATINETSALH